MNFFRLNLNSWNMRIFERTKKRTVLEKNMKRFISERPHSLNWFFLQVGWQFTSVSALLNQLELLSSCQGRGDTCNFCSSSVCRQKIRLCLFDLRHDGDSKICWKDFSKMLGKQKLKAAVAKYLDVAKNVETSKRRLLVDIQSTRIKKNFFETAWKREIVFAGELLEAWLPKLTPPKIYFCSLWSDFLLPMRRLFLPGHKKAFLKYFVSVICGFF